MTLVDDQHPLMRLLWFSAGAIHPACESARELLVNRERRPGLLAGLPLLDAKESGDARDEDTLLGHYNRGLVTVIRRLSSEAARLRRGQALR